MWGVGSGEIAMSNEKRKVLLSVIGACCQLDTLANFAHFSFFTFHFSLDDSGLKQKKHRALFIAHGMELFFILFF
jgi:hypothetical protein